MVNYVKKRQDFLLEKEKEQYYFDEDLNDLFKGTLKERFEEYIIK